ncbi:MAG: thermonuclease family protein [Patescibacteria group bacterium]
MELVEAKAAKTTFYKVTRVIDGDTIEVKIGAKKEKVRLIGIDTPETVDPRKPVQCFGKEASDKAKELMQGKKVRLEADKTNSNRDKYKRLLRYVYLKDASFVNEYMVKEGYAHAYIQFPFEHMAEFEQYQKEAIEGEKGLWDPKVCPQNDAKTTPPAAPVTLPDAESTTPSTTLEVQPSQCLIKGNISSSGEKIYHDPSGSYYSKTAINESDGEKWFCSEGEAKTAGWRKSTR